MTPSWKRSSSLNTIEQTSLCFYSIVPNSLLIQLNKLEERRGKRKFRPLDSHCLRETREPLNNPLEGAQLKESFISNLFLRDGVQLLLFLENSNEII